MALGVGAFRPVTASYINTYHRVSSFSFARHLNSAANTPNHLFKQRRLFASSSKSMASMSQSLATENLDKDAEVLIKVQEHQRSAAKLPAIEEIRTLLDSSTRGMLSTFSENHKGYPSGSMVDFSCDNDGCPILAISHLAVHYKDLAANSRCSLLVAKDPMDRTDTVVTVYGDALFVSDNEREVSRTSYLRKHPGAFWVDFGDFHFVRIAPKKVRYVSGVATALLGSGEFNSDEFMNAKVDPIAQFSVPVTSHMNRDHEDDTKLIVQHSTKIKVDSAKMIDIDRLGFNVKVGIQGNSMKLRIPFPRAAEDRKDVKTLIVQMLEDAKKNSM